MNLKILIRSLLALWIVVWVVSFGIFHYQSDRIKDYRPFFSFSVAKKQHALLGNDLYEFIQFSKARLPPNAKYKIIGIDKDTLEYYRLQYFLYPHLESSDPEFILVYNVPTLLEGFELKDRLNEKSYILEREAP